MGVTELRCVRKWGDRGKKTQWEGKEGEEMVREGLKLNE